MYNIELLNKQSNEDVKLLLNLLQENFNKSIDYYVWKHNLNQDLQVEEYTFCVFHDNLCIASLQLIINTITVSGKIIRFGLLADGATHKNYRRFGLFEKLLNHCKDFSSKINVYFFIGSGNEKSRKAFLKLEYQDFFSTVMLKKKIRYNISILKPLNRVNCFFFLLKFKREEYCVEEISSHTYIDFIKINQKSFKFFFNKPPSHLEWRLKKTDGKNVIYGFFDKQKKLQAVAIVQFTSNMIYIKDILSTGLNTNHLDKLIKYIIKQAWLNENITRINCNINDFNSVNVAFQKNGLKLIRDTNNVLIKIVNKNFSFKEEELENMHYMRIDKNE
ncbi:GNAT family N-acetyltransferase [Thalassobellus citreus]|uniref:GNAT family N-acetyltransferase n=1 Tax=Thalassobellus citreus TaxID=3367752 RepID=UPI003790728A